MVALGSGGALMTKLTRYHLSGKGQVFNVLLREILAARPNVSSGEALGVKPPMRRSV